MIHVEQLISLNDDLFFILGRHLCLEENFDLPLLFCLFILTLSYFDKFGGVLDTAHLVMVLNSLAIVQVVHWIYSLRAARALPLQVEVGLDLRLDVVHLCFQPLGVWVIGSIILL